MSEQGSPAPEFNPMRFPPCACVRCRCERSAAKSAEKAEGGEAPDADDGDSALLRQLRARVVEENGLRNSLRRDQ
ncbi:hypothetical protein AB0J21_18670 [Streptomyces sp. NPDC049954]|uniref:hypothetical protein n=1 Tax=Streptomyces sp. NPDC049954 TaxID=3155779 RepID=UPI00341A93A1